MDDIRLPFYPSTVLAKRWERSVSFEPRAGRVSTATTRGFATTSVATHLTLNHGFPIIRLSQLGACIDLTDDIRLPF